MEGIRTLVTHYESGGSSKGNAYDGETPRLLVDNYPDKMRDALCICLDKGL